jgi:hypothetical protein
MIGLRKTATRGSATVQTATKAFAGGAKPKPIDPKTTDFDVVFVGKSLNSIHATSLKATKL